MLGDMHGLLGIPTDDNDVRRTSCGSRRLEDLTP
jgi:hypothetical protein